jgi:hypothetical protein
MPTPSLEKLQGISTDQVESWIERFVTSLETSSAAFKMAAGAASIFASAYAKAAGDKPPRAAAGDGEAKKDAERAARPFVEGRVTSLKERGDWVNAEVTREDGRKVWLSTKKQEQIMPILKAHQLKQLVRITYTEHESKDQKFGPDRYITKTEVISTPTSSGALGAPPVDDDDPF